MMHAFIKPYTRHSLSVGRVTIDTVCSHLANRSLKDGEKGETSTHDTEHTTTNKELTLENLFGPGNGHFGEIDKGTDSTAD